MNWGAGTREPRDSRMPSIHEEQCRLDIKIVVVTLAASCSCGNLGATILARVDDILTRKRVQYAIAGFSDVQPFRGMRSKVVRGVD